MSVFLHASANFFFKKKGTFYSSSEAAAKHTPVSAEYITASLFVHMSPD